MRRVENGAVILLENTFCKNDGISFHFILSNDNIDHFSSKTVSNQYLAVRTPSGQQANESCVQNKFLRNVEEGHAEDKFP